MKKQMDIIPFNFIQKNEIVKETNSNHGNLETAYFGANAGRIIRLLRMNNMKKEESIDFKSISMRCNSIKHSSRTEFKVKYLHIQNQS